MTELKQLHEEFLALKAKLFGKDMFVIPDEKDATDWKRYDELYRLFQVETKYRKENDPILDK